MSTLPDLAFLPQKIFRPLQESPNVMHRNLKHSIKWNKKSAEVFHQKHIRTDPIFFFLETLCYAVEEF